MPMAVNVSLHGWCEDDRTAEADSTVVSIVPGTTETNSNRNK